MAFSPLNWLLGLFSLDIGIDLGTANTLVYVRGKGIVINEPSWVAVDKKTRRPLAIGAEAKELVGRTPTNILAIRPLRDGVISEFEITEAMLRYFIDKAHEQNYVPIPRPRVVVGVPSGVTEVEKRAVYDATLAAGGRGAAIGMESTFIRTAARRSIDSRAVSERTLSSCIAWLASICSTRSSSSERASDLAKSVATVT